MSWSQPLYWNDFTQYFFDGDGELKSAPSVGEVPQDVENFANIGEALSSLQSRGCWGLSNQLDIEPKTQRDRQRLEALQLDIAIVKIAIEKYGEILPVIYRGRNPEMTLPIAKHKVLFGSPNRAIAAWYGEVIEYRNVKALRYYSKKVSVVDPDNADAMDEEVVFFPESIA
jgi:hypothetical protein